MPKKRSNSDLLIAQTEAPNDKLPTPRRMARFWDVARNRQRGLMVVMEDVHNPHNLAAIARSCDAFGVQQLAAILDNPEHFDPAGRHNITSASASKWLDYRIVDGGTQHGLQTLKREGWHIMATIANEGALALYEVDFAQLPQLAVLVGNEHAGLSQNAVALADSRVYIPMMGMTQSFNVSVATAIILSEVTRQRNASPQNFRYTEAEAEALVQAYMLRDR